MKVDPFGTQAHPQDVSLSVALLLGGVFWILFEWLKSPRNVEQTFDHLSRFAELNVLPLGVAGASLLFNAVWIFSGLKKIWSRKLSSENLSKKQPDQRFPPIVQSVVCLLLMGVIGFYGVQSWLSLRGLRLLPFVVSPPHWALALSTTLLLSVSVVSLFIFRTVLLINLRLPFFERLPRLPVIVDGIVLGAIHESEGDDKNQGNRPGLKPEWMYQGLKGLTGNLFVTGVIGSGKSQILLRILKQILSNFSQRPALLAIDPKRTFVAEFRRIVENLGLQEHLLWISLNGTVRFNPIWREGMLRNSGFTTIANTLRLAAINFLGSSSDQKIWEQLSFNLIKSTLIFCAAKYEYFTFKELYLALVQARDEGVADQLEGYLDTKEWDEEERSNIEMAVAYFRDEFSQMDQKIRSSILVTATGFLNEFQEYRISRILSPKKEDITFFSVADLIRDGKIVCLHIENDSLARSTGTLLKLLYQEAVLERVNDPSLPTARHAVLVMDEYQDVATSGGGSALGDDRYLAKARESKGITIAATQSVSSVENAIRSEPATRELLQNFRSRIFGNSTDPKTIRLFQDAKGTEDRERQSHSVSESAKNARSDLFGGFDSSQTNTSESLATHYAPEYSVTAREFSRLRTFETFAQLFDGLETRFEKLYLKPYFLREMRTSHYKILAMLREAVKVKRLAAVFTILLGSSLLMTPNTVQASVLFPNICSVVKSSSFQTCLGFTVSGCMCGFPVPRPCAQMSYYVPQTFLEVWPDSRDSFFSKYPGVKAQLLAHGPSLALPFGVEDEQGEFSFQARAIAVPFSAAAFMPLPCGGTRIDKPCFDAMSEDLGPNWHTGSADLWQPSFLAWSLSPKLCLLKGAASGLTGDVVTSIGPDSGGCSSPLGAIPKYPPSPREACNGWGLLYPRSGIYQGGSRSGAALMIAARMKSLGTEILHTVPGDFNEKWQMISPQSSACFKEGENLGALEAVKGLREESRMLGKSNGYLFVVWKKVSCCHDLPEAPAAMMSIQALTAACAL